MNASFGGVFRHHWLVALKKGEELANLLHAWTEIVSDEEDRRKLNAAVKLVSATMAALLKEARKDPERRQRNRRVSG
ncbi:MAG: hypothetical protein Kow0069_38650 [Promethearchaeota archaeon]